MIPPMHRFFLSLSFLSLFAYGCEDAALSQEQMHSDSHSHDHGRQHPHNKHHHHPHDKTAKTDMDHLLFTKNPSEIYHASNMLRRCGGLKHSAINRPCHHNDTMCGHWIGRYWHPSSCYYDDIKPEQARKCLGNRTLAFIGDSQNRDLAAGVARFLLGHDLSEATDDKFGYPINLMTDGVMVPPFPSWNPNVPGYNAFVFPQPEVAAKHGFGWQVQSWNLYRSNFQETHLTDVLNNTLLSNCSLLRPLDLAFYSYGLHEFHHYLSAPPYEYKFYIHVVERWARMRSTVVTPTVWVSMNNECKQLIARSNSQEQADIVEDINYYTNHQTLKEKLPYWDASAVLRTPSRCNVSGDGVHVKMFVDVMRAKMLFNHLCDHEMNWRGSADLFV
jgi:hypothetical protein